MPLSPLALLVSLLAQAPFVPAEFQVPNSYESKKFKLSPLGPSLAKHDFDAYMSSIEHLQKTFSFSTRWPNANITMADAVKDVEGEKARFDARKSFTYAVLSPDGSKELGCVYVSPSRKQGYDAQVRIWVTKAMYDQGFESELIPEVKSWLTAKWPFQKIAWPGREISKEDFAKLPDKQ